MEPETVPAPNYLHVMAEISRLVGEGKDASQVYHNIREKINLDTVGISRSKVEKEAKAAIESWGDFRLPVENRMWDLKHRETLLRADIVAALQGVDMATAGVVREIHKVTGELVQSSGYPTLIDGLDTLDELGYDTTALRKRLDELGFPELEKDPEPTPSEG